MGSVPTKRHLNNIEQVQRKALRFIAGDYKTMKPGTIHKLQDRFEISSLQTRRKAIRLTFMFKVVEGLVPAMPSNKFINLHQNRRMIRPKRDKNFSYKNNTIDSFVRNNDRTIEVTPCNTDQRKYSFFPRTAIEWNHLENTVVHAKSPDIFKTLLEKHLD